MRRRLGLLLFVLLGLPLVAGLTHADLLDRVRLENALQERLLNTLKIYDESGRVLVRLEIHGFANNLPGTTVEHVDNLTPDKIEMADIGKVSVTIFSQLEALPPAAKTALMEALPLADKSKVVFIYSKLAAPPPLEGTKPMEIKDLASIVEKAIANLVQSLALILAGVFLLSSILAFVFHVQRVRESRAQFRNLTEAVSGSDGGRVRGSPSPSLPLNQVEAPMANEGEGDTSPFMDWSSHSVHELLADAYWCGFDRYAHWVWKNLAAAQRTEALRALPFLKDYCAFFLETAAECASFHDHPYYLEPTALAVISQEDLSSWIKKDLTLWHALSPMRRQTLPLKISQKISILQLGPSRKKPSWTLTPSATRKLELKSTWSALTLEDEISVFENPDTVPPAIRPQFRSLVWLALKDQAFVKRTLERYDARSLASAWVGPDQVLQALETALPEKKLKLVQNYRTKVVPSRNSEAFRLLVEQGFRDDAA